MSRTRTASRPVAGSTAMEANKATIRYWIEEGWNKRNAGLLDEICAADIVEHDPGGLVIEGVEALKAHLGGLMSGMPDVHISIEDLIAEGDVVVWRGHLEANHTGTLMNIPPTGKPISGPGLVEFRFADGKIAEVWAMYDLFGMLRQIGVIPDPA